MTYRNVSLPERDRAHKFTRELWNFRHPTNTALLINDYLLLQRLFLGTDTDQSTLPPRYRAHSLIVFSELTPPAFSSTQHAHHINLFLHNTVVLFQDYPRESLGLVLAHLSLSGRIKDGSEKMSENKRFVSEIF